MTPEMKKRITIMASKTWNAIGGDILRSLEEAGGDAVMTRGEVVEVVCDSEYLKMYGQDKEAYEFWWNLPTFEEKENVIKEAFPFQTYGW